MDKAYHIIHALKGVAGNLAIIQVADAATSIEAVFGKKQSGDVKEKISKLDAAIDRAINSINQLEQVPRVEKMPKKKKDPAHLKELFNNMLPAFDQFSPNAVEPFLSELEAYLSREQLDAIVKYIELFEFESAKQETIKLGKTLGIYHGKYKQNR